MGPPSRSPSWNPSQRDAPPLEPSFVHLSQSPVYDPHPPHTRFPSGGKGPPWREMPISGDFPNIPPRVPVEELPPRPHPRSLFRERWSIPRAPFTQLSKSLVDEVISFQIMVFWDFA